jgi:hypothetical protein
VLKVVVQSPASGSGDGGGVPFRSSHLCPGTPAHVGGIGQKRALTHNSQPYPMAVKQPNPVRFSGNSHKVCEFGGRVPSA